MPYGFRVRRKRAGVRRRRGGRSMVARVPRPLRMLPSVMKLKRKWWSGNWTLSTGSTSGFWRYFQVSLQDMPSNSDVTNLFDQYKIYGVRYELHPRYDNFAGNDTIDTTLPNVTNQAGNMVHVVNDPRSVVIPTGTYTSSTLNTFMEQGKVRTHRGYKPIIIYHRPTISQTQTTGARQITAPWLQTANTNIAHSGAHVFLQDVNLTGTSGQSYDLYITIYMACRGVR